MSENENAAIIAAIRKTIKGRFENDSSGHDFFHIERVYNLAIFIAKKEGGDLFIVGGSALLHETADWKFYKGDDPTVMVVEYLSEYELEKSLLEKIVDIVTNVSFKGAGVDDRMQCLEGRIVQDADRLDAMGAIGIARTFAFGGRHQRAMYQPDVDPELHQSFEEYQKSEGHTINHFYEKLLLLKDRIHTQTGMKIARERHRYMEQFLEQFYKEWNFNQ